MPVWVWSARPGRGLGIWPGRLSTTSQADLSAGPRGGGDPVDSNVHLSRAPCSLQTVPRPSWAFTSSPKGTASFPRFTDGEREAQRTRRARARTQAACLRRCPWAGSGGGLCLRKLSVSVSFAPQRRVQ